MEACDLILVLLKKHLNNLDLGFDLEVGYIYDYRVVDVAEADWVLVYMVNESVQWFDIGANNYLKRARVSIDVRTEDRYRYGKLKSEIQRLFDGKSYVFKEKAEYDNTIEEGVSATAITKVGMYLRKADVTDPSIYTDGEYVRLVYADGSDEVGWIVWIYGNEVWVFTREGQYMLMRPDTITDLSDKLKKLYRFVMDVQVMIVQKVK